MENNKLIAEFMGFKQPTVGSLWDYNRSLCHSPITRGLEVRAIEGNLVCFVQDMAYKGYGIEYFNNGVFCPANSLIKDHLPHRPYHTSWDWLMPVVEKISQFKYEDGETAYLRTFGMPFTDGLAESAQTIMVRINRCECFHGKTLIEAVYLAVIGFIKENNAL